MTRRAVTPQASSAVSSYSPGILAEGRRMLFISGQVPSDPKADTSAQVRQVFQRIEAVLREAGATFKDVAMVRGYFVNLPRDLEAFRTVRTEFLSPPYPASTVVGVAALAVEGVEIEIEAVAVF